MQINSYRRGDMGGSGDYICALIFQQCLEQENISNRLCWLHFQYKSVLDPYLYIFVQL